MAYVIIDVAEFNFLQFRSYLQIIFESMDFFVKCLSGIVKCISFIQNTIMLVKISWPTLMIFISVYLT